jgi:hypothetical protein
MECWILRVTSHGHQGHLDAQTRRGCCAMTDPQARVETVGRGAGDEHKNS